MISPCTTPPLLVKTRKQSRWYGGMEIWTKFPYIEKTACRVMAVNISAENKTALGFIKNLIDVERCFLHDDSIDTYMCVRCLEQLLREILFTRTDPSKVAYTAHMVYSA